MRKPIVSVIVPVYNAEKYLRECLESIQNQTLKDIEIICVNDGSTDGSKNILKEFAKKDQRFVILNKKNSGVNSARAEGYKKAHGKYIAWADNDDILEPTMYEKLCNEASKNKSEIVICNYKMYPKNVAGKEVWYRSYEGKNDWKFIAKNTTLWNKIVSKKLLDKLDIVELFDVMGESAYGIVLAGSNKISTIEEPLYNYRVGHGSASNNYQNIDWFEKTVDSTKKKYEYSKENNFSVDIQNYFYYCYLYYNLVLMSVAAKNANKEEYNSAKKVVKENKFFSKKYKAFFTDKNSFSKRAFFRGFIYPNYGFAKVVTRLVMR